jgi:enoyl-CoA hydratase/carnithine racemase
MIDLDKKDDIFVLTLNGQENRWNTAFVRVLAQAIDEIEASQGAAALVTTASSKKFFSNGLDLAWREVADEQDRAAFLPEFMILMGRIITLPIPSICAINGHAFGAGFMMALCHDVRLMREDRGFACANEVEIGMVIPDPELALFKHKLPANVFFETVQLARRWTGPEAEQAGIVSAVFSLPDLLPKAIEKAESLKHLGSNRLVYQTMKERLFGQSASINDIHGAAHLLKNGRHVQSIQS